MRFLTGFPGFLGSALAPRLLARDDAGLVCLVQPRWRALAETRAREIEREAGRPGAIRLVDGDLTRPDLGLGDGYDALRASVREVYHLAAVYDLGVEAGLAERVNVDGTRHVLRFIGGTGARLHYVSTCYVSGRHAGAFSEDDLDVGQAFYNHYERTKYQAELDVRAAMAAGLATTVYRPSIVVGDSRTGATQKYDGPYAIVRWLLRWRGAAPLPVFGDPSRAFVNLVPQDFVIDALDALSRRADTTGATFALADPAPLTVAGLLGVLERATGRRTLRLALPRPLAEGALRTLPALARWMGIAPDALPYFAHPARYSTARASAFLAREGITCPPFASYADRLVAYVRAHPDVSTEAMV